MRIDIEIINKSTLTASHVLSVVMFFVKLINA